MSSKNGYRLGTPNSFSRVHNILSTLEDPSILSFCLFLFDTSCDTAFALDPDGDEISFIREESKTSSAGSTLPLFLIT